MINVEGSISNTTSVVASNPSVTSIVLKQWESMQNDLRSRLILENTEPWQNDLGYTLPYFCYMIKYKLISFRKLKLVAGLDISYPVHYNDSCDAFAAVVICKYPSMAIVHEEVEKVRLEVPYIAGKYFKFCLIKNHLQIGSFNM